MSDTDHKTVSPCASVRGALRVPGDKSISHRAAIVSALASGESAIRGFLMSEDCLNTLSALDALGAKTSRRDAEIRIKGTGGVFRQPAAPLDLGNSGTGMRLMAGLLAGQPFSAEMTGDASLRSRPMRRIKEPLELMGAQIELLGKGGCAPVRVRGGHLRGIEYRMPVASAQVKSCVLLAGLFARGGTVVVERLPTRDHTERMLRAAGVVVESDGLRVALDGYGPGPLPLKPREWDVPGDFSSAAFWLGAAACREGSELAVENVGLNPRRTAFLDVLRRMGADVEVTADAGPEWEPAGTIAVKGRKLKGAEIGGAEIPNLIDEIPMLAVLGSLASGRTVIRDAAELRVKESDRIATMASNLAALGVKVAEKKDGMIVDGGAMIRGNAEVDSFGDHRIAMAMAALALFADGPVTVKNVACIATSYPGFWDDLEGLTGP